MTIETPPFQYGNRTFNLKPGTLRVIWRSETENGRIPPGFTWVQFKNKLIRIRIR